MCDASVKLGGDQGSYSATVRGPMAPQKEFQLLSQQLMVILPAPVL